MAFFANHLVVKFQNPAVNPTNFQLCDADFFNGLPPDSALFASQLIAYFAGQGAESAADGTNISEITFYEPGSNFGVSVPFPTAEYAAIRAAFPGLPAMSTYGVNIGRSAEGLAPLGTSIVMTEYSATGGPGGRGRHFLPFISENLVDGGGFVAPTAIVPLRDNYFRFLMNDTSSPALQDLLPQVVNAGQTTQKEVVQVKTQSVFSNLRSRRR